MRFVLVSAVALGAGFVADAAWPQARSDLAQLADMPLAGRFDYEVVRAGARIGTHSVMLRRDGEHMSVATRTDVSIDMLGITVFRFGHEAAEVWVDGRLARLSARTDDDGEEVTVDLERDGDRLRGTCNGTALDLPADLLPASLWHPEVVRQTALLDPYTCAERRIEVDDHGIEPVVVKGHELTARHYTIVGELRRDIWYGPGGRIVRVSFPAKDDSEITFLPIASPEAPAGTPPRMAASLVGYARVDAKCLRNC